MARKNEVYFLNEPLYIENNILEELPDNYKTLYQKRYIEKKSWNQISNEMNYYRSHLGKMDTKLRKMLSILRGRIQLSLDDYNELPEKTKRFYDLRYKENKRWKEISLETGYTLGYIINLDIKLWEKL